MIEIKSLASGSSGNCYRISDGHTSLLLEAGIRFKDIRVGLDFKLSQIAGCLISHEHFDHSKAVKEMAKAGIDVYISRGSLNALGLHGHRLHFIKAKEQFSIGSWTVLPFEVQHSAAEPLGFLLSNPARNKLLYATDTSYLRYRFVGLTHLLIEANYSERILNQNKNIPSLLKQQIMRNHFSLENVKEFLKANDISKIREIHLLHLSDANSNAKMFKREVEELTGKPTYIIPKKAKSKGD